MASEHHEGEAARSFAWSFGKAEFDEGRWLLSVDGAPVELERKPLEVLQYLLRHAGEAVTKDELLSTVWAGRVVVEAVLTNAIGKLRRALGDDGATAIVTLPRVGYRLDGQVMRRTVEHVPPGSRLSAGDTVPRRGNWVLEQALARHGDGEVWLARHAKTGEARVFKFSLDGQRLAGLKREVTVGRLLKQALGEQPGFVDLHDWNFKEAPYFVEFAYGGEGLDRWTDAEGRGVQSLLLETRLSLFVEAVDAVAAAHGVGVLHKDLKPANMLVHGGSDELHLRVVDFGSSGLFDSGRLDDLGITRLGLTQPLPLSPDSGTPLYMAPEVLAGQVPTIWSDVYALGVVLYQLVVGDFRRPLAAGWEADVGDRLLREDIAAAANGNPALRPASAAMLADRIRTLAQRREKAALEAAVRDRIEVAERGASLARARRPWVISAMAVLVLGLGATATLLHRSMGAEREAEQQRDSAQKQAARAEAVVKFISNDLIGAVSPGGNAFERNPTIRELLVSASTAMEEKFPDDPATRASIHGALGISWRTLGDREQGEVHLRAAVEGYREAFGPDDEQTLRAQYELVGMLAYAGKFDEAHALLDDSDARAGNRLNEDTMMALRAALLRGVLLVQQQRVDEAVPTLQRADRLQRTILADDAQVGASIRVNLSDALLRQDGLDEAEHLLQQTLADPAFAPERIGEVYVSALRMNLARVYRTQGRFAEALSSAEMAVAATEKVSGPDSYQAFVQTSMLSSIHYRMGDCPTALHLMRHVHSGMAANFGADGRATLVEGGNLAAREFECGDKAQGVALARSTMLGLQTLDGDTDSAHGQARRYALARMLVEQGQYTEALGLLQGLQPELLMASDPSPGWPHRLDALRGEALIGQGAVEQGRLLLGRALDGLASLPGIDEQTEMRRLRGLL